MTCVAISPDSTRLVSSSEDKTICMWNLESREVLFRLEIHHYYWATSVAFTMGGTRIVSSAFDSTIRIWDSETGEAVDEPLRGRDRFVGSIAISRDDTRNATGSWDSGIFIATIKDSDSEHDDWKQNCRRMDVADGWIKDGEKLMLWVPPEYRHWFRGNVDSWIRNGLQE